MALVCKQVLCSTEDLDRERALDLPQEVIHFLASILIDRGTDRPDKAEDEPQFNHPFKVFCVGSVHLKRRGEKENYIVFHTGLLMPKR